MDVNKLRINLKANNDSNDTITTTNSLPTLTHSPSKSRSASKSRSRSRLPVRNHDSPLDSAGSSKDYRERHRDKSKLETNSSQLHIQNTSANSPIKLPQFQKEQDSRGRSRDRENNITSDANLEDSDEDPMISLMGFAGFASTKGKPVKGSTGGAAKKQTKSQYRQYMNRPKGFSRPLSPGR